MSSYPVSANRELVAFGTINLFGSLLNCFPSFSSIARSQVNDSAGARTQLAGVITGILILLTILFLLPIFYYLPKCVMASIVVVAAAGLLEWEDVHFIWKIRAWSDMFLMLLTFAITIFWSVEAGTLISIGLSLILVIRHSTKPKIAILGKVVEAGNFSDTKNNRS
jgi:MFS superfamily sulfate permease-like transporter